MKTCVICNEEKPLSEYYKQKKNTGGLNHKCKDCCKAYNLKKERNHQRILS